MSLPTLLIPGLNCSPRLYQDQMPMLWRHGPVMVVDHRQADTVAGMAETILAAAPPRFALAGFSLGGFIAFEMLRRAPERVAKLALISTNAVPKPFHADEARVREERIAMALGGRFAELSPLHFPYNVHPARRDDAVLKAIHARMTDEVGVTGYVNQQRAIASRPDSRPLLGHIACPTTIVAGDGDTLTPPERAVEMHAAIRDSELVVIPDCGHLAPLERPEAVGEALAGWIARPLR